MNKPIATQSPSDKYDAKTYSSVRIRKEILKELDLFAEWHNVDRQEALKMLLLKVEG